jgi:dextranase
MNIFEVLPSKATYVHGDEVEVEIRNLPSDGLLTVWELGQRVFSTPCTSNGLYSIGVLAPGGYGVEVESNSLIARTAVEVSANHDTSFRYGFVVDYSPERRIDDFVDTIRRLHLSGIQFYDWAYRHADLLGGGNEYLDALGQPISLDTVKSLVAAVQGVGTKALGYAAVYAVGTAEWDLWKHDALLDGAGKPFSLGDFLFILDPASSDWLQHFSRELQESSDQIGFDGFHLDQYGYPRQAVKPDGTVVDVARSFVKLIKEVRKSNQESVLIFNNVNDFPTWATAHASQDAIYIEVWPPHTTLQTLSQLVNRTRQYSEGKPIVIAAYQHVYDNHAAIQSDLATKFTMATLFSHGASQLLAGEADRILVDPYYVRNHIAEDSTRTILKDWYDFLVENSELLVDSKSVEVTNSYAGDYNNDCDVTFSDAAVVGNAEPGTVWRRIISVKGKLVMHLINLVGQSDILWDSPRNTPGFVGEPTLRIRVTGNHIPRVRIASPDGSPRFIELPVQVVENYAEAILPALELWQVVEIDLTPMHAEVGQLG